MNTSRSYDVNRVTTMLLEIAGNYEIFIRILRWNDTALPLPASNHQAGFGVAGVDFPVLLVRHARWRSAAFEMRRLGATAGTTKRCGKSELRISSPHEQSCPSDCQDCDPTVPRRQSHG